MADDETNNSDSAKHLNEGQDFNNLIEEYKDVKFLNVGMAQNQDEAYVSAEVYLTGDIQQKLIHAQAAQKTMAGFGDNSLNENVTALMRALELSASILKHHPEKVEKMPLLNNDNETFTPAKHLPEGWGWVDYEDGSGSLQSPDGKSVISYDYFSSEYKIDGEWYPMTYGKKSEAVFDKEAWEKHFNEKLIAAQKAEQTADYSHAYASCVTSEDSDYLDNLIKNAADVKEPFVVVKGFTNYDFNVPKLKPMPFIEASERFKEMNSPTSGFWLIHKENEETNKLNIFPYHYDKTGQKGSEYRDANKSAEYHDLHSYITKELRRAQDGLNSSKSDFSGISLLPDQEAIDRGYAALVAVDADREVNIQKRGEMMFTEDELVAVGIKTASLWGAEYISHEINQDEGVVKYLCVEHGEMFNTSLSFEKVQEELQEQHAHDQNQNVKDNANSALFVDMSDWCMAKDYNGAESFMDGSRPLIAETQYADIIICRGHREPNAVALSVCIGEYYYDGEVATKELAIEIGTRIAEQINATGKQQFENGSFRDFFYSLQITDISLQDGIGYIERNSAVNIQNNHEKENSMSKYDITARVNPLPDQSGKVKAMASVTIDNAIAINSLTVVEGNNGNLFVGYPQSKGNDDSYRDIVEFLKDENGKMTKESLNLKDDINKLLTEMYKNGERATPEVEGEVKEPVMHEIKAFVTPLRDSETATKGIGSVQIGEMFKINSVRINENTKEGSENFGKNFVAMPSRPDKSTESGYRDIVHPVTKEYGEVLRDTVLKQFDNQMAWKNHMANKETPAVDKPAVNKSNHDLS